MESVSSPRNLGIGILNISAQIGVNNYVMEQIMFDAGDLSRVVRLLGDLALADGTVQTRRRLLVERLAELIGAFAWFWAAGRVDEKTGAPIALDFLCGGLTAWQLAGFIKASSDTVDPLPVNEGMVQLLSEGKHFTRDRQDMVDDDSWYGHRAVRNLLIKRGIEHILYTIMPTDHHTYAGVGFMGRRGTPPFTKKERRIVHIVTSEVRWLTDYAVSSPSSHKVQQLSPRLRTVLSLLLDAFSCDQIADMLRLSPFTVREYMSDIYRHFSVQGHIELIHAFRYS